MNEMDEVDVDYDIPDFVYDLKNVSFSLFSDVITSDVAWGKVESNDKEEAHEEACGHSQWLLVEEWTNDIKTHYRHECPDCGKRVPDED